MSDDACYEGFGGVLGRAFVDLFERGDNPKAAAIMRRVARAAEVKRALDDARKSTTATATATRVTTGERRVRGGRRRARRRAFHVTGDAMFGFGCGAFASEHRLGTVDRANRAASARPSRANVGGVSGGVSVSVASPPRWNVVATSRARPSARISPRRRVERNRTSDEIATQTAPEPAFPARRRPPTTVPVASIRNRRDVSRARLRRRRRRRHTRAGSRDARRQFRPRRSNSACRAARRRATGPPWGCAAAYPRVRARVRNRRRRGARPTTRRRRWRASDARGSSTGGASEKVRVMKGDATVAASGSASSPADDPQRWGALPRERRDGETRFGEKSARGGGPGGTVRPRRRVGRRAGTLRGVARGKVTGRREGDGYISRATKGGDCARGVSFVSRDGVV